MQKQKLIGVVPFNEFFFKSCYFNQLLACYSYYGADREVLLKNYLTLYSDSKNLFKEYCVLDKRQLRKKSGINDRSICEPEDFAEAVIKYIDKGVPVIAAVDSYLLPYRKDTYQEVHGVHYLLIVGYDRETGRFDCVEHMFKNSYNYKPMEISIRTVSRAHKSAVALRKTSRTFVAVYRQPAQDVQITRGKMNYLRRLILNSCSVKNQLLLSIPELLKNKDFKQLEKISGSIAGYRWKLFVRAHTADMDNDDAGMRVLQSTANNLVFISGILFRAAATDQADETIIKRVTDKIKEVVQMEDDLHRALLHNYCNEQAY